jgi:hypothetical protein
MKKKMTVQFLALVLICFLSAGAAGAVQFNTDLVEFAKYVLKYSSSVHSYDGYMVHVMLVGGKPVFTTSFVSFKKPSAITAKVVFIVKPEISSAEMQATRDQLTQAQQFKAAKVLRVDDGGDNPNVVRFDSFDDQGVRRSSLWVDKETGFQIQKAMFDANSALLGFIFYKGLRINPTELMDGNKIKGSKMVQLGLFEKGGTRKGGNLEDLMGIYNDNCDRYFSPDGNP